MFRKRILVWLFCVILSSTAKNQDPTADTNKKLLIKKNGEWFYDGIKIKEENVFTFPTPPEPTIEKQEEKPSKWILCLSAVPTVFAFLIAVIIIALKDQHEYGSGFFEQDENGGLMKYLFSEKEERNKRKPQQDLIYDEMFGLFKEIMSKEKTMEARKSSQIKIKGLGGKSPKRLAMKHNMIGKLNKDEIKLDVGDSVLDELAHQSVKTFMRSSGVDIIHEEEEEEEDCL